MKNNLLPSHLMLTSMMKLNRGFLGFGLRYLGFRTALTSSDAFFSTSALKVGEMAVAERLGLAGSQVMPTVERFGRPGSHVFCDLAMTCDSFRTGNDRFSACRGRVFSIG